MSAFDELPACKHCGVKVVDLGGDPGDGIYTHEDGMEACSEELWAIACEEAGDGSAADHYDSTYAEPDLPCPKDPDGQHFVGCGCDA